MDKFGINVSSVVFYTINFFILLFLLNKFLFKPVNKILEERKKMSMEIAENLAKSRSDLTNLEQRVKENLIKSNNKAQEIIEEAKKSSTMMVLSASTDAQIKTDKMFEEAKRKIEEEKINVMKDIKSEVTSDVIKLFKKLVGNMPTSDQQKLIDDTITKV